MSDPAAREPSTLPERLGALIVFAKEPVPGRVKTRLVPPFSPQQAAEFYDAMLQDVLEASSQIARVYGLRPILAIDPPEALRSIVARVPGSFRVIAQRGQSLGERMDWAMRAAAAGGANRILLRGSDSPVLDAAKVGEALHTLDEVDLVVCPDLDGGYNLIGLREPCDELFEVEMSTGKVFEQTRALAAQLGLRSVVLPPHHDVDDWLDLSRLDANRDSLDRAPRTRRWLAHKSPP